MLRASAMPLVVEIFDEKKPKSAPSGASSRTTVGSQFHHSLKFVAVIYWLNSRQTIRSALMETLNSTEPHYVRCIKPNDAKEAFRFEPKYVFSLFAFNIELL